jgi:protein phosphatase
MWIIDDAHQYVRLEGTRQAQAIGSEHTPETTFALLIFCQQEQGVSIVYAHAGDSRIYLLRPNEGLTRLTDDDGYLSILLENQEITPEDALRIDQTTHIEQLTEQEISYFNKRNGITQALGDKKALDIHMSHHDIHAGDKLLLCTDGIHDNLTDEEIATVLAQSGRTRAAQRLVQRATRRSQEDSLRAKNDDMTAIVVSYEG